MKKIHNKQLQNIICSVIAVVMIFGVLATVAYTEEIQPNTFQKVILEAISLPQSQRAQFVDNVLANLTATNYKSYVAEAKGILGVSISDADLELALKSYANYPDTHKSTLNELIKNFALPKDSYNTSGFPDIKARINFLITGDSSNDDGFKLFVELFKNFKTFNSKPIFYDGENDIYKLDIRVDGHETFKGAMDKMIESVDTLNKRGVNDFNGFVDYFEAEINANSYSEIYALKSFLNNELGSSAYAGNLPVPKDPLQLVLLSVLKLPQSKRITFVNEVLIKVTPNNYTSYVKKAKQILEVSISDSDMESALKVYASLSQSNRAKIEAMIKVFDLSSIEIDTKKFKTLAGDINYEITGDRNDNTGIKFVVKSLEYVSVLTGPMVTDGKNDKFKVSFIKPNNNSLIRNLDYLISLIKSLENREVTNFDSFLAVAESIVNDNDNGEIYYFKKYLKEQYG
ncbi:MAG TPA: S-layer homology domain-containing protein, partial [Acetivibrio sp.]|nr:S-layer homology domain-containing protein [Acetivibrio sp.]